MLTANFLHICNSTSYNMTWNKSLPCKLFIYFLLLLVPMYQAYLKVLSKWKCKCLIEKTHFCQRLSYKYYLFYILDGGYIFEISMASLPIWEWKPCQQYILTDRYKCWHCEHDWARLKWLMLRLRDIVDTIMFFYGDSC